MGDIHVTQELLDGVVSGKVSSQVLAQVGWQHLMALCPFCRSEFEAWKQSRQASGVAGLLNALPLVAERQERSLAEKRQKAEEDLRVLLRLPQAERLAKVRRANSRFRGAMLARMLLDAAEGHIPAEPKTVYELAETARVVLSRTLAGVGVADLCARAAIYMGNSLRAQGDLKAAERHFAFARHVIVHNGVTDPVAIAEVDWFEGTLRKDQRRFAEAEELLLRAATFYRLAGEEGRAAYPLVTLGLLQADRQEHREARDTFLMALRLINPGKDARLYCYAHHNLARSLCYLGNYAAAAEALAAGRDFYGKHPDPYTQSRVTCSSRGSLPPGSGTSTRPRRPSSPSAGTSSRRATATTRPWPRSTWRSSTSRLGERRISASSPRSCSLSSRPRTSTPRPRRPSSSLRRRCARSGRRRDSSRSSLPTSGRPAPIRRCGSGGGGKASLRIYAKVQCL